MQANQFIQIPQVGSIPAFLLDPNHRTQVSHLIERAEAKFRLSASSWVRGNNSGDAGLLRQGESLERKYARQGEALLAPLGIKCDWPGLYPSFNVHGHDEHDTRSAVLAALGKPRNWIPA